MKKVLAGLVGATALLTSVLGGPAAGAPAISMSGAQESGPGDHDGHGFFTYDIDGTSFCYTLRWDRVDTATAAHVHVGPRHTAGPVVIPLSVGDGSGSTVSQCTTIAAELASAILADPKAYYVNVHNPAYPAGAVRGQLK
jgi:hypothetical protein